MGSASEGAAGSDARALGPEKSDCQTTDGDVAFARVHEGFGAKRFMESDSSSLDGGSAGSHCCGTRLSRRGACGSARVSRCEA